MSVGGAVENCENLEQNREVSIAAEFLIFSARSPGLFFFSRRSEFRIQTAVTKKILR